VDQIDIIPAESLILPSSTFRKKEELPSSINQISKNDTPVIYIITCIDPQERFHLIKRYHTFNLYNIGFARSQGRINIAKFNNTDSETFYVGSTMNSLKTRITQHLGAGNDRTYALHLSKWDNDIMYTLNIQVYKIKNTLNFSMERTFIELIEQAIWEKHNPVFGKKSGL